MVFRNHKISHWAAPLFAAAAILVLAGSPAHGQVISKVTGVVTDHEGNPLAKVPVIFEVANVQGRGQGTEVGKPKTKKNGRYTYPFLEPGSWKIYPRLEGYLVLKVDILSIDSEGTTRMEDPEVLISRDQSNMPTIPVAPQGRGAVVRGRCEVSFVMVPEADYSEQLAKLQGGGQEAATPAAPVVSRKRDPLERGDEFLAGGDFEKAAAAFQEAADADPSNPEAFYGLGKALLRKDDISGAQNALMKAGQLDPEMPGVNFYLATIYTSLAQDAAAIAALEKERINSPEQEEVLENLASLYLSTEQADKAQEVLTEVRALNPENTNAALLMADLYNSQGKSAEAEEVYRQILELNPGQQDVIWYNIGVNAYNAGNRAEAATAFEKSLDANKKNPDSHKMLGYTLVGLGKIDEAIPHFETYLKLEKGPEAQQVQAFLDQLKKG
jgi:tetratricopeptide (TPR) repeat protein